MTTSTADLNEALARIGRLPRRLGLGLVVVTAVLGCFLLAGGGSPIGPAIMFAFAALVFGVSLRVGATATAESLVVRSYFRTYRFLFEMLEGFDNQPYAGMWNIYSVADGKGDMGLRMLDVTTTSGRGRSLPATMMSRKSCAYVTNVLNERVWREDSLHPLDTQGGQP